MVLDWDTIYVFFLLSGIQQESHSEVIPWAFICHPRRQTESSTYTPTCTSLDSLCIIDLLCLRSPLKMASLCVWKGQKAALIDWGTEKLEVNRKSYARLRPI
jgi:hypothetical protein